MSGYEVILSSQRLSRQRKIKRKLFSKPIVEMTERSVVEEKVSSFVLVPDSVEVAFKKWWYPLPDDHIMKVRYPHEKHGLTGKVSNSAKTATKQMFLQFVDLNSQPNGRRLDSRNPTHYFLPKFKTISQPKRSVSNYESKVLTSLVCEFNRCQTEAGQGTVCSSTVLSWLKEERPKVAIYPHQSYYCDYCSKVKKETQACQQKIARHLQSGSTSEDVFEKLKKEKEDLEKKLEEHRKIARESLQYYHQMKEKCASQWKEIVDLQSTEPSPERDEKFNVSIECGLPNVQATSILGSQSSTELYILSSKGVL